MRLPIFAFVACVVAAGCSGADGSPLPVAPASDITVATQATTLAGSTLATMITQSSDCPPEWGIGLHAASDGASISVVFPRWPEEGAVYDLSVPGTSDFVVVSATSGLQKFCAPEEGGVGTILVNRFEQVGDRYLADVEILGVGANAPLSGNGAATLDGHLYH